MNFVANVRGIVNDCFHDLVVNGWVRVQSLAISILFLLVEGASKEFANESAGLLERRLVTNELESKE